MPRAVRAPSPRAWMGTRKAAPGTEVGRDLLGREASEGRRAGATRSSPGLLMRRLSLARPEPVLIQVCTQPSPLRPDSLLRLMLPCSLLLSGGAVRPHQSDPAAWHRPRGAGADGGRGHVHPGVCWLCGGPAGEHLPAQVCEWPPGRGGAGDAWGLCWAGFFLIWPHWEQLLPASLGPLCAAAPDGKISGNNPRRKLLIPGGRSWPLRSQLPGDAPPSCLLSSSPSSKGIVCLLLTFALPG